MIADFPRSHHFWRKPIEARVIATFLYFVGIWPWLFALSILSFYFVAAAEQGAFPSYGNPDPKYSAWYGLFSPFVMLSLYASVIFLWVWAAFVIFPAYLLRKSIALFPFFLALFGYVFAILIASSEVMNWFLD